MKTGREQTKKNVNSPGHKLLFVITGLASGGAEMMLYKLLAHMDRSVYEPFVLSLTPGGILSEKIRALDIPVLSLNMNSGVSFSGAIGLIKACRKIQPDVIQGWMVHGNAASALAGFVCRKKVLWGVRHSNLPAGTENRMTMWLDGLLALISPLPKKIIYNSEAGRIYHESIGYRSNKSKMIPNGFDTDVFKPSTADRVRIRQELRTPEKALLIGMIGRFHPMKDHDTFLQAAAMLIEKRADVRFILAGRDCDRHNVLLYNALLKQCLIDNFSLLGERKDIANITAALDIATSSSFSSEGFSNSIGEAMSCGVPCIVTDVGDSQEIVGDTGIVVPARDPAALMRGWLALMEMGETERNRLGYRARERIISRYSIQYIVKKYEEVYQEACV